MMQVLMLVVVFVAAFYGLTALLVLLQGRRGK